MRKMGWALFLFFALVLLPVACTQLSNNNIPSSPVARSVYTPVTSTPTISPTITLTGSPTVTRTFTLMPTPGIGTVVATLTPTVTVTANPNCPVVADVSSHIGGTDYLGNDLGHTLPGTINLDQGGTSTGDLLSITLTSAQTLNFTLCPTEDLSRGLVLYIRSNCSAAGGEYYNAGGVCDTLPQITGVSLAAGTYYLILAESSVTDGPGAYDLRITSNNPAVAVCTVVPTVTPVTVPSGTYVGCSNIFPLNNGAAFSGQAIATGSLTDINTDDFYSFVPSTTGTATVILDCFDNGLDNVDFDIFAAASCPTSGSAPPLIAESESTNPVEEMSFAVTAGSSYYIDVEEYLGSGAYRLTVQSP